MNFQSQNSMLLHQGHSWRLIPTQGRPLLIHLLVLAAAHVPGNSLRFFSAGDYFGNFGLFFVPLGALDGAKWWGNVVGCDCLILSQIGLILPELC